MPDSPRSIAELEARFTRWVEAQADIRLAIVVGSQARTANPADAWADFDTVVFSTAVERYDEAEWLNGIGAVWVAHRQIIRPDMVEWLVVLAGGLDFDMVVVSAEEPMTPAQVDAARLDEVLARGVRVLLDRDGVLSQMAPVLTQRPAMPDSQQFAESIARFWRYVERAAKKLRRGELWMAKTICDGLLKESLLQMLAWHARAANPAADTWHDGHFLEQWADPRFIARLSDVYAIYQEEAVWQALVATSDLFRDVAQETATRLGYPYLIEADQAITGFVRQLYETR